jgi:hypothetical protein
MSTKKAALQVSSLALAVLMIGAFAVVATSMFSFQSASAATSTTIKYKGNSANAYWSNESNGVYTDVYLFATDYRYQQKSSAGGDSVAYMYIYQYTVNEVCEKYRGQTYCWYDYVPTLAFDGYVSGLDAQAFQATRLDKATLNTQITGYDWVSGTEKTITANVAWSGIGDTSSGNYLYNYRSGDYTVHSQGTGSWRQADVTASIGGDITVDVDSFAYKYAYLENARSGYVEIVK